MYWYSIAPLAGIWKSVGISTIMSGLRFQPSTNCLGAGRSFASPSGAPLSAQEASVAICSAVSLRSLEKWPTLGSANQGGIFCVTTAALIALAHGRASVYVSSDMGAT